MLASNAPPACGGAYRTLNVDDDQACSTVVQEERTRHTMCLLLLLSVAYGLSILASYFYSCLMPAIETELNIPSSSVATLVSIIAIASGIGKFFLSVIVVMLGAKASFLLMLACQAWACASMAFATSFSTIAVWAMFSESCLCMLWPASLYMVQSTSATTREQSQAIWGLGIASRIGAVSSGPIFGALAFEFGWRRASALAAIPCVISALCLSALPGPTITSAEAGAEETNSRNDCRSLWEASTTFAKDVRCWWCAGSMSLFTGIKVFDQTMVSLYLKENSESGLVSDTLAITLGPSFTVGVLFAVVCFGHLFTQVSPYRKTLLVDSLNCFSGTSMIVIAIDSFFLARTLPHVYFRCLLFSFAGLGMGLSFYQPSGLFVLRVGGSKSGLLAGVIDGVSYAWSFIFVEFVSLLLEMQGGWTKVWWFCCLSYWLGVILTSVYVKSLFAEHQQ